MKNFNKFLLVLMLGLMTSATVMAQNTDRYITLTVQQGQQISLDLYADAANTPIKVVSGSSETTLTIGIDWTDFQFYHAGAGTMTVYGNIKGFDCSGNGSKITALDASHNTALEELYCSNNNLSALDLSNISALIRLSCYGNNLSSLDVSHNTALELLDCSNNNLSSLDVSHNTALMGLDCAGNNFTTQAYDDLMCSLLDREAGDNAMFIPLYDVSDANYATFMASDAQNAINKSWKVLYYGGGEIPATAGNYDCSSGIDNIAAITATLYPNPVKDILHIQAEGEILSLQLYDMQGRLLISQSNMASNSKINIENLSNGIYLLKLQTANGILEYKIVKE